MAARKQESETITQETEKRKLDEGLDDGELSTDSEFEAPRKLQKTVKHDKVNVSASTEVNSSTYVVDESRKTDIETKETEVEGETTLTDDNVDSDDDLDDNEIYAWQEKGIEKQGTKPVTTGSQEDEEAYIEKEKIILKEIGRNPFEVLPEGWVIVTHNSGMPIFLHKQSRVCTAAKPYFLGSGSVRKHSIPISGIPCLHYRREKEKIAKGKERDQITGVEPVQSSNSVPVQSNEGEPVKDKEVVPVKENDTDDYLPVPLGDAEDFLSHGSRKTSDRAPGPPPGPRKQPSAQFEEYIKAEITPLIDPVPTDKVGPVPPKIKIVEHNEKEFSIEPDDLHKYCEGLFDFKTIIWKKFETWKDKQRHLYIERKQSRPSLPSDIKLITCPAAKKKSNADRDFVLNPVGKTPLCILHEYVQNVLKVQPEYIFKELEKGAMRYSATVRINNIEYAPGLGSSKKQAKLDGAKKALEILMPHLQLDGETKNKKDDSFGDMTFFDEFSVEDPRIAELCGKAGVNKPYHVLRKCLQRNYGLGEMGKMPIDYKVNPNHRNEFTITVGKHTASVVSTKKQEGKEKVAQAMLQLLHPHIKSWGSILRLYSESTTKGFKEKAEVFEPPKEEKKPPTTASFTPSSSGAQTTTTQAKISTASQNNNRNFQNQKDNGNSQNSQGQFQNPNNDRNFERQNSDKPFGRQNNGQQFGRPNNDQQFGRPNGDRNFGRQNDDRNRQNDRNFQQENNRNRQENNRNKQQINRNQQDNRNQQQNNRNQQQNANDQQFGRPNNDQQFGRQNGDRNFGRQNDDRNRQNDRNFQQEKNRNRQENNRNKQQINRNQQDNRNQQQINRNQQDNRNQRQINRNQQDNRNQQQINRNQQDNRNQQQINRNQQDNRNQQQINRNQQDNRNQQQINRNQQDNRNQQQINRNQQDNRNQRQINRNQQDNRNQQQINRNQQDNRNQQQINRNQQDNRNQQQINRNQQDNRNQQQNNRNQQQNAQADSAQYGTEGQQEGYEEGFDQYAEGYGEEGYGQEGYGLEGYGEENYAQEGCGQDTQETYGQEGYGQDYSQGDYQEQGYGQEKGHFGGSQQYYRDRLQRDQWGQNKFEGPERNRDRSMDRGGGLGNREDPYNRQRPPYGEQGGYGEERIYGEPDDYRGPPHWRPPFDDRVYYS